MIRYIFLLSALLFVRTIEAQNLSPTVVNASGGVIQNSAHLLEWSLGELAVSTLTSPDNLLTQGFLQPAMAIVGTEEFFDESRFSVFPNPVSGWLNIQTDIPDIKSIQVYDVVGKLVLQISFQQTIDLRDLESGTFVVLLFDHQGQCVHAFKISKI